MGNTVQFAHQAATAARDWSIVNQYQDRDCELEIGKTWEQGNECKLHIE